MQQMIQTIINFISDNLYVILAAIIVIIIVKRMKKSPPPPSPSPSSPTMTSPPSSMPNVAEQMKSTAPTEQVTIVTDEDLVSPSPIMVPNYVTPSETGNFATADETVDQIAPQNMIIVQDEM